MDKYKIIINASNLKKGGALQVALSFIEEALKIQNINFYIFSGRALSAIINNRRFNEATNCTLYHIDLVATKSLTSLGSFRKQLNILERTINPQAVITIFGQCYWRPHAPHIMGFANPYLLYQELPFHKRKTSFINKIKTRIKNQVHLFFSRNEANFLWVETIDARNRASLILKKPLEDIVVASNSCNGFFNSLPYEKLDILPPAKKLRLIYISSYYPHKNIEFIPDVLDELRNLGIDCECIITIDTKDYQTNKKLHHTNLINIGPVHPRHCPYLYSVSDILFMPSLLEVFSATYPEAMYMQIPIVTSDLPFAKDVCGRAALYYPYDDAKSAALQIFALQKDPILRNRQIENGKIRLKEFDSPESRFRKILTKVMESTHTSL